MAFIISIKTEASAKNVSKNLWNLKKLLMCIVFELVELKDAGIKPIRANGDFVATHLLSSYYNCNTSNGYHTKMVSSSRWGQFYQTVNFR